MSTRVSASAKISAACRDLVNQRLNITLGSTVGLGQMQSVLESGRVDLPTLQGMLAGEAESVLSALAPASPCPGTGHPGLAGARGRQPVGRTAVRAYGTRQRREHRALRHRRSHPRRYRRRLRRRRARTSVHRGTVPGHQCDRYRAATRARGHAAADPRRRHHRIRSRRPESTAPAPTVSVSSRKQSRAVASP